MPEDQKPFIHQDGTSTPPGRTPAAKLLDTSALAVQVRELQREQALRKRLYPGWVDTGRLLPGVADEQLRILGRAIESVQLLQEPRVNTTVGALKLLTPSMQALVSDVAIALTTNPAGQQNLANALRKLIEGRS